MTRSSPLNAAVLAACFVLASCTDGERMSSTTASQDGAPTATTIVAAPQSTSATETQPATTNEDSTTSEPFRVAPAPRHNGRFDIATGAATREPVCDALQTYTVDATSSGFRFAVH